MFPNSLLEALCRTGNFPQMVDDACANAKRDGRTDDVTLYRLVGDQVANAYRAIGWVPPLSSLPRAGG